MSIGHVVGPPALQRRRAFTLVELLVVVGIVSVLTGVVLTATMRARGKGQQAGCASNLRQLVVALSLYADDYDGRYPAVSTSRLASTFLQNEECIAALRPYVNNNEVWFCPSDPNRGKDIEDTVAHSLTSYMTRTSSSEFPWDQSTVPDNWSIVHDGAFSPSSPAPWHFGGYNAAYADGSVKWKRRLD